MTSLTERIKLVCAIAADPRCRRAHVAVAHLLFCFHYNTATGRCDPSVGTLAKSAATNRRNAQQAVHDLEAWGYLGIEVGRGTPGKFGPTNAYTPSVAALGERPDARANPQRQGATVAPGQTDPQRQGATKPVIEPVTHTVHRSPPNGGSVEIAGNPFEIFWRTFPTRRPHSNPKQPARSKFEAVVTRGIPAAAIIAAAERYAEYVTREGIKARFVSQAVTWLNQARWEDDHEPEEDRPRAGMV